VITSIAEDRMMVISDVHLGNRLFRSRRPFIEFLKYACANDYNLCINGDGVDISQTSLTRIARDLSDCAVQLRKFSQKGLKVYYVVGNHDIVMEYFLDDWELVHIVPFLNVTSGDKRIRIEHGHLFDESFVETPFLYMAATLIGGFALRIHPKLYEGFERTRPMCEKIRCFFLPGAYQNGDEKGNTESIPNEPVAYRNAAAEISRHGFDYIILGHTHCAGEVGVGSAARYMNTGSWLFHPHYVEIDQGQVELKRVVDLPATLADNSSAPTILLSSRHKRSRPSGVRI